MERADRSQYEQLQKLIDSQSHDQISALTSEILKQHPDDFDSKLSHMVSLIHTNNTKPLDTLLKTPPTTKDPQELQTLYAYYLYLIEDYPKAIKYLQQMKTSFESRLLLSQCFFKNMEYGKSAEILVELVRLRLKEKNSVEAESLMTNLVAALERETPEKVKIVEELGILDSTDREIQFNLASFYSQTNRKLAQERLNKLTDSFKLPEDQEDRVSALLLKDFINYESGIDLEEDKVQEYQELGQQDYKDLNLGVVISNNLAVFKERQTGEHTTELLKEIEELLGTKGKQTRDQILRLKTNKLILLLRRNKTHEAQKLLKDIQANYPEKEIISQTILKAKLFLLIKTHETKEVETLISSTSSNKVLQFLLRIEYLRLTKQLKEIFAEYKKAPKEILNDGIISKYIISLALKDQQLFESQLEEMYDMATKTNDVKLMKLLVEMFRNKGNSERTFELLERILRVSPKDEDTRLQLAQIRLNSGNILLAEELLKGFERPNEITDMNYLQTLENNIHFSVVKTTEVNKNQVMTKMKKRIKKRKVRYPKNFDPKNPGPAPNPERWLPKHERKGNKKNKNYKSGRTQGATVGKESVNVYSAGNTTSNINVTSTKNKRRKN